MNRDHCVAIIKSLPVVQAIAEGRNVYFAQFDWRGKFIKWQATDRIILGSLAAGLYSVKPRYQCFKPAGFKGVPYPEQQALMSGT